MGKRRATDNTLAKTATSPASAFAQLESLRGQLPAGATSPDENIAEQSEPPRRFAGKLVVRRERSGRGGKTVTIVSGVLLRDADQKEFVRRMRSALGTGAHLEDEQIVLNGSIVERVANWLEAEGAQHVIRVN